MNRYLKLLQSDPRELDLLAKDLLINVTSFFRDPKVFDFLAEKIIPELIGSQAPDHILRVWVAGCSTGEETYSLVMLFREAITSAKRNVKLQVFASDVDPDAVAVAREGFYPQAMETDVSAARLARFFTKEDRGYRILPELRAAIVFTVQDVLADPPFSRLDFVSCRNLLIYLGPEAQRRQSRRSILRCVMAGSSFSATPKQSVISIANSRSFPSPSASFATSAVPVPATSAFRSAEACGRPRWPTKDKDPRAKPPSPTFVNGW